MSKLEWDKIGEREYETGIDHGVLYPVANNAYPKGVAWSGLSSVSESPSGGESNAVYADNIKYLTLVSAEEFGGTIEAYMYPDEFAECDGSAEPAQGVFVSQQTRKSFGLSYRTLVGNDTEGNDFGEKIHLVYGCKASPSEKSRTTVNDSPEATQLSWEFSTIPVVINTINPSTGKAYKPTSHMIIDSTKVPADALAAFKDILYGTENTDPRLPMPDEVIAFFTEYDANPLSALTIDANIDAATDLFGKSVTDLQTGVSVGATSITGTLKHVAGYTGFSSKTDEQEGNYLALHAAVPGMADAKITVTVTKPSVLDEDGLIVLLIKNTSQTVTVKAEKTGYDTVTKVFTLNGLTLQSA